MKRLLGALLLYILRNIALSNLPVIGKFLAELVQIVEGETNPDALADLIAAGATAQEARSVLPNSLKTEIVMTMNMREWRHFFKLRTAPAAHPQMREVAVPMLQAFKELLPSLFSDIEAE